MGEASQESEQRPAGGPSWRPRLVTLFVPCYVDQLRPEAGIAALELLEAHGFEVDVRLGAICCGQPFANAGYAEASRATSEHWLQAMSGAECVAVLASSCAVHLQRESRARPPRGADRGAPEPPVLELMAFLARFAGAAPAGRWPRTVCLHSSCHGLRESDADRSSRALLARVQDLRVVRAERADECCGFGGGFSVEFPELSVRMGHDRLREIVLTGADEVVATDVSCLLHLEGIARAEGVRLEFRHVSELLRDALREAESPRASAAQPLERAPAGAARR